MNTTTAAANANVTIRTIQRWCRTGRITATKIGGRWHIDPNSLTHATQPKRGTMTYQIEETTTKYGTTRHRVTSTKCDRYAVDYVHRADAELHAAVLNAIPDGYWLDRRQYRAPLRNGPDYYWRLASTDRDELEPLEIRCDANEPQETIKETLINVARQHAEGATARKAKKAEADARAAEAEAARQEKAERERMIGPLATPRQVKLIRTLLAKREYSGEGGGFFLGPTDEAGIEMLSRRDASRYITSLTGKY